MYIKLADGTVLNLDNFSVIHASGANGFVAVSVAGTSYNYADTGLVDFGRIKTLLGV